MKLKKLLPWIVLLFFAYTLLPELFQLLPSRPTSTPAIPAAGTSSPAGERKPTATAIAARWPYLEDKPLQSGLSDDLLRKNYYVVFDGSGSMSETACSGNRDKLSVAKQALITFAGNVPQDANLGMLVFDNEGISERTPLGIRNRDQFVEQVRRVYANRSTPLLSSISKAFDSLTHQAQSQLGYGEYHLVIVTDGFADPDERPRAIVEKILSQTPIVIHTIGFCISDRHSLNQPGRILYRSATDPDSLQQSLDEVLAESPDFSAQQFQ